LHTPTDGDVGEFEAGADGGQAGGIWEVLIDRFIVEMKGRST